MAKYRLTPRRREALRRAQLASARKRRKNRNRNIALGGAGVLAGVGVGAFLGHSYIRGLKGGPRPPQADPANSQKKMSTDLVHVPGHGKAYTVTVVRRKPKVNPVPKRPSDKRIYSVNKKGEIRQTTKGRLIYDHHRRREYWQAKPVPKLGRRSRAKKG